MTRGQGPLNTLKPQPGQYDSYQQKFHPLPGQWAQEQLESPSLSRQTHGSSGSGKTATPISKALAAERAQHEHWEKWQGVTPGKAVYEDPRSTQNTLLPSAKYGTEGRGYG